MEQMGKKSNNLPKEQNYKNSADGENSIRKKYKIRNVAIRIQVWPLSIGRWTSGLIHPLLQKTPSMGM